MNKLHYNIHRSLPMDNSNASAQRFFSSTNDFYQKLVLHTTHCIVMAHSSEPRGLSCPQYSSSERNGGLKGNYFWYLFRLETLQYCINNYFLLRYLEPTRSEQGLQTEILNMFKDRDRSCIEHSGPPWGIVCSQSSEGSGGRGGKGASHLFKWLSNWAVICAFLSKMWITVRHIYKRTLFSINLAKQNLPILKFKNLNVGVQYICVANNWLVMKRSWWKFLRGLDSSSSPDFHWFRCRPK